MAISKFPEGRLEVAIRERRRAEIKLARKSSERVKRDGRTYRLVRLPSEYDHARSEIPVDFHRHVTDVMKDSWYRVFR